MKLACRKYNILAERRDESKRYAGVLRDAPAGRASRNDHLNGTGIFAGRGVHRRVVREAEVFYAGIQRMRAKRDSLFASRLPSQPSFLLPFSLGISTPFISLSLSFGVSFLDRRRSAVLALSIRGETIAAGAEFTFGKGVFRSENPIESDTESQTRRIPKEREKARCIRER